LGITSKGALGQARHEDYGLPMKRGSGRDTAVA
jgi:hypothetical protein